MNKYYDGDPIKLCYFIHPKDHPDKYNFGDLLSHRIVEKVLGRTVVHSSPKDADLFAIGSIMTSVVQAQNAVVWGTGVMFENRVWKEFDNVDFIALRGLLSAEQLNIRNDIAFGDPALLCSEYFKKAWRKKYRLGVIPHYVDMNHEVAQVARDTGGVLLIDVFDSPENVCKQISQCNAVVSSSLHGIIVAHSYGVPAGWIELSDKVAGEGFKFRDYYSVFDRHPDKVDPQKVIAGSYENYLWAPSPGEVRQLARPLAQRLQSYWDVDNLNAK